MVYNDSLVLAGVIVLEANLIPLEIMDLYVILGMNWLANHHAYVNSFWTDVAFHSPRHDLGTKILINPSSPATTSHDIGTKILTNPVSFFFFPSKSLPVASPNSLNPSRENSRFFNDKICHSRLLTAKLILKLRYKLVPLSMLVLLV